MSENENGDNEISSAAPVGADGSELDSGESQQLGQQFSARSVIAMLVVVVLIAGFCVALVASKSNKDNKSATKTPNAIVATVNGTVITRADFDATVASWISNKLYVSSSAQQGGAITDAKGVPTPAFRLKLLNGAVQQILIDAEFNRRHLRIPSGYVETLRAQITSDPIAKGFAKAFLDKFIQQKARSEAFKESLSTPPTAAQIAQAYAQQFACPSGIGFAFIAVSTQTAADQVEQQLKTQDFATLAKARATAAAAANAGVPQCYRTGALPKEIDGATKAAVLETPTAPVKYQNQFYIIKTSKFVAPSLAASRSQIVSALQQNDTGPQQYFANLLKSAKVTADPSFGHWADDGQGGFGVVPNTSASSAVKPGANAAGAGASTPSIAVQDERPKTTK